ncbi:MAG TPA: GNAT family N-acetyltransferase [Candidatus Binataceae bacterium]|nr:GNAT family N-acetyltransferase [Candidatus Binataceae bacterium]
MNQHLPSGFVIDAMTEKEARILDEWAAKEGWNPGLNDIAVAWTFDPAAFIALRRGNELIGGGCTISYHGAAGFMGLFIVQTEYRRQGLGTILWHERLKRLKARVRPDAPIGMDGVFEMVPFYTRGGFALMHRDLRYEGVAAGEPDPAAAPLDSIEFLKIDNYDCLHVETRRTEFLRSWLTQPGGRGLALIDNEQLTGYGFIRPCRTGYKVGPAFADDAACGKRLIHSLLSLVAGERVLMDIPEPNEAALRIVEGLGWNQSFGCARMVNGPKPALPVQRIFGVTSFEFG